MYNKKKLRDFKLRNPGGGAGVVSLQQVEYGSRTKL